MAQEAVGDSVVFIPLALAFRNPTDDQFVRHYDQELVLVHDRERELHRGEWGPGVRHLERPSAVRIDVKGARSTRVGRNSSERAHLGGRPAHAGAILVERDDADGDHGRAGRDATYGLADHAMGTERERALDGLIVKSLVAVRRWRAADQAQHHTKDQELLHGLSLLWSCRDRVCSNWECDLWAHETARCRSLDC